MAEPRCPALFGKPYRWQGGPLFPSLGGITGHQRPGTRHTPAAAPLRLERITDPGDLATLPIVEAQPITPSPCSTWARQQKKEAQHG